MNAWHSQSIAELEHLIATDVERGLTDEEVAARLVRNGPNKLRKGKRFSVLAIIVSQFKSLVIWVLIGAAAVSTALWENIDGISRISIGRLKSLMCFRQEFRA